MAGIEIIGRSSWGAEAPLSKESLIHPISYIRTVGVPKSKPCYTFTECVKEMKEIQHNDMYDGKQQDIRSNFYIGDDGKVYEGRGWFSRPPEHPLPMFSSKYLEIAHIGGSGDKPPTKEFLDTKAKLIDFAVKKKFLSSYHTVI